MCINKEVSITTFITSTIVVIYLWVRNYKYDKWYALFLLTFASIQFWEFLLWIYKGTKYDYPISGIIIPITICLELLVPYLGKLWYQNKYNWNIGGRLINELKTSFFPYILFGYVIALSISLSKKKKESTTLTPQGSLNWNNTFKTTESTYIHGFIFAFLMAYTKDEEHLFSSSLPVQRFIFVYTNFYICIFIDCTCSI